MLYPDIVDVRQRGLQLLHSLLPKELSEELRQNGDEYFEYRGWLWTYRIYVVGGATEVYSHRGNYVGDVCIQPLRSVTTEDRAITQYLMLRSSELRYLHTGNLMYGSRWADIVDGMTGFLIVLDFFLWIQTLYDLMRLMQAYH